MSKEPAFIDIPNLLVSRPPRPGTTNAPASTSTKYTLFLSDAVVDGTSNTIFFA